MSTVGVDNDHEIGSMSSPLATLEAEHRLILRVVHALETWAEAIADSDIDGRETLRQFLRFFREFAEGCHHKKEEEILFATMDRYGLLKEEWPVSAMLREHDEGRRLLLDLVALAEQAMSWTASDRLQVSGGAHRYARLMARHIANENREVYPLAENSLPARCWDLVATQFEQIESQAGSDEEQEGPLVLAKRLVTEFSKVGAR